MVINKKYVLPHKLDEVGGQVYYLIRGLMFMLSSSRKVDISILGLSICLLLRIFEILCSRYDVCVWAKKKCKGVLNFRLPV